MKVYADLPGRRFSQIVGDLLFVGWMFFWARIGVFVHDATMKLAAPGRLANESATTVSDNIKEAGHQLTQIPLVGDEVAKPFDQLAGTASEIARAGQASVQAVENLAWWLGWVVALIPILLLIVVYVPLRFRFIRRATAGQRFIDSGADLDLFALRALANQPMQVLGRLHEDPAGAWRRGEPAVIQALAEVELRTAGLRPPRG